MIRSASERARSTASVVSPPMSQRISSLPPASSSTFGTAASRGTRSPRRAGRSSCVSIFCAVVALQRLVEDRADHQRLARSLLLALDVAHVELARAAAEHAQARWARGGRGSPATAWRAAPRRLTGSSSKRRKLVVSRKLMPAPRRSHAGRSRSPTWQEEARPRTRGSAPDREPSARGGASPRCSRLGSRSSGSAGE